MSFLNLKIRIVVAVVVIIISVLTMIVQKVNDLLTNYKKI